MGKRFQKEAKVKCVICKNGETQPKATTVTLEKGEATLVFKNVPALVCSNCGETYVAEETTSKLLENAQAAVQMGVRVDVREFKAA